MELVCYGAGRGGLGILGFPVLIMEYLPNPLFRDMEDSSDSNLLHTGVCRPELYEFIPVNFLFHSLIIYLFTEKSIPAIEPDGCYYHNTKC